MFGHDFNGKQTTNGFVLTGKVWASPRADGNGHHLTPRAGETLKVVKGNKTRRIRPWTPVALWVDEFANLNWEDQPPVPALTKEQGMVLAYDTETPEREWFQALLFEFCQGTPPAFVFSSNNIWHLWCSRQWPEPSKRAFVGPTMQHGEKAGWMEFVEMVPNTMGHSHSNEMNRGYRSLISRGV